MTPKCPECGNTPWYFGINEVWCPQLECKNHRSHDGKYHWCNVGSRADIKELFKSYEFVIHVDLAYKNTPFSECALKENLEVFKKAIELLNPNTWNEKEKERLLQIQIDILMDDHT